MRFKSNHAFTLIELSMALVIIGLLTGAVVVGKDMIRMAELKKNISTLEQFNTATLMFENKYDSLPGDMPNATNFWGAKDCTLATGTITRSTNKTTCNGNGDGRLASTVANPTELEQFCFFQHLSNAEMISGNYSCAYGSSPTNQFEPGIDLPTTYGRPGVWYVASQPDGTHRFYSYRVDPLQGIVNPINPVFSPDEAYSIDSKFDDGLPMTGKILSMFGECAQTTGTQVLYKHNVATPSCILEFRTSF